MNTMNVADSVVAGSMNHSASLWLTSAAADCLIVCPALCRGGAPAWPCRWWSKLSVWTWTCSYARGAHLTCSQILWAVLKRLEGTVRTGLLAVHPDANLSWLSPCPSPWRLHALSSVSGSRKSAYSVHRFLSFHYSLELCLNGTSITHL